MKHLFSLLLAGLAVAPARAQSFEWAREQPAAIDVAAEYEKYYDVAAAASGHVAVAGYQPGPTGAPINWPVAFDNVALRAYDATGALVFSQALTGPGHVVRLRADAQGSWLLLGQYQDSLRLTATTQLRTPQAGQLGSFVAKYSPTGQLQWARPLEPDLDVEPSFSKTFTTDATGNLYLAYTDGLQNSHVVRLAASGQGPFQPVLTQTRVRQISSLDLDAQGRLLVAGACPRASSVFGDRPLTLPDDYHFFAAAYDLAGHCQWVQAVREGVTCQEPQARWDDQGGAYLAASGAGYAFGSLPGQPTANAVQSYTLAHLSAAGTWDWVRQSPNPVPNTTGLVWPGTVNSLSVDGAGNAYWAGYLRGSLSWGAAGTASTLGFQNDALLLSYDRRGALRWVRSGGGVGDHFLQALAHAPAGAELYAVGMVNAGYTFGPLQSGQGISSYVPLLLKLNTLALAATPARAPAGRWQLSPNPAHGPVAVRFGAGAPLPAAIMVLDALGRPVRTTPVAAAETAVPVAGLAPGLYVLRATAGAVAYQARLVVE